MVELGYLCEAGLMQREDVFEQPHGRLQPLAFIAPKFFNTYYEFGIALVI